MSKAKDHPPHDHSQDHGDHDHAHEHGDHDHDHGPVTPAPLKSPEEPGLEDAGSRALADALKSSFVIVKVIMVVLVVLFFASGVFTVAPQEKAVVFRFGKPLGTSEEQLLGPGLHWSFPYPIDRVVRIPIGQIQTVESTAGWYATSPEIEAVGGEPEPTPSLNPAVGGYTLTADGNIIHVRARMGYRVTDPLRYAFGFTDASGTVQHALDNAIIFASAHYKVDDALRLDVAGFKDKVTARIVHLVNQQALGIAVGPVEIRVSAPLMVKPAFNEVLAAEQDRSKVINAARGYENSILSKAQGEANAVINRGEGDRARLIQSAASEAQYLTNRLAEYDRNPRLFTERVVTETWKRILTNAHDKFVLNEGAHGAARELRLLLNREPEKPATNQVEQP